jgi:hypothetical protein
LTDGGFQFVDDLHRAIVAGNFVPYRQPDNIRNVYARSPYGQIILRNPFATFIEALDVAGNGTEIVLLSGGVYQTSASFNIVIFKIQ